MFVLRNVGEFFVFLPPPPLLLTYPLRRFVAYIRKFIFLFTQMSLTTKGKQVVKYMPLFITRVTENYYFLVLT